MSLRDLGAAARARLRRHAWLLTLWCVGVGVAASWLLLRVFDLRNPVPRYSIAAIAMYMLGLVVGARVWLAHFSAAVAREPAILLRATADEQAQHDLEAAAAREDKREGSRVSRWDWLDALDIFDLGEASLLLVVPALVVAVLALAFALGGAPVLLMDGIAGLLAEVAVQFVFGALIARRVMRPRGHDEALMSIVGRTWVIGILLVAASAALGWTLRFLHPGAVSIVDLAR